MLVLATAGCAAIDGMQKPLQSSDRNQSVCPQQSEIDTFNSTPVGPAKGQFRDKVVHDCVKAMNKHYDDFLLSLHQEAVYSNLIPEVLNLGLSGGAALTKPETAKEFTQAALAVAGVGTAINKDVFYQQTMPAIQASMDAKRYTLLQSIVSAEKTDPTGANYSLQNASFDLDGYEAAGNVYGAISELTKTATDSAAAAKSALDAAQIAAPYQQCVPSADVQARLSRLTHYIKPKATDPGLHDNAGDRATLDKIADALQVQHAATDSFSVEQGRVVATITRLVSTCGTDGDKEVSTLVTQLSPIAPALNGI
jgi:hypothetical protein